jgi:peptidoglycan/LPS O-acetylase OafA/YrhL
LKHSDVDHSTGYRPDIDGLRAIAVLAVVAFHAFPWVLPGGLIGVDIFFVISGYLISTIIYTGLEANRFSFLVFYGRRVARIFPALMLVLAACMALGWTALLTEESKQLGRHVASGAGFVSNFILWSESGYFDNASDTKPLLHLWSLGIEEQFYIFWPFLMWTMWKLRVHPVFAVGTVAVLSFALNVHNVASNPVGTFYSPLTRAWELAIGGVLALSRWQPKRVAIREVQSITGIAALLIGLLTITKGLAFPGYWALLPTIGAALIISAKGAWLNRVLIAQPAMVFIGLISYPLYLWHWPLLSFARVLSGAPPDPALAVLLVAVAIALSVLTYQLVERPIRASRSLPVKAGALFATAFILGGSGYAVNALGGLDHRAVVRLNARMNTGEDGMWGPHVSSCGGTMPDIPRDWPCIVDTREPPRLALVGDSKAGALATGVFRTSHPGSRWVYIGGSFFLTDHPDYQRPADLTKLIYATVANMKSVDIVVIANATRVMFPIPEGSTTTIATLPSVKGYFDIAFSAMLSTVRYLLESGKRVVLVIDNPTLLPAEDCGERVTSLHGLNKLLGLPHRASGCAVRYSDHVQWSKQYRDVLLDVQRLHPGQVDLFDAPSVLCDTIRDICGHYRADRRLYSYADHVSDYAAGLLGERLNALLDGTPNQLAAPAK